MHIERDFKKIVFAVSLMLGLGACVPTIAQYTGASEMKRNEVSLVRLKHTVHFAAAQPVLDGLEKDAIEDFLLLNQVGYGDSLSIDLGDTVAEATMAERWFAVYEFLSEYGIRLQADAPITGAAPEQDSGTMIIERYIVTLPTCEKFGLAQGANWANAREANFGCATTSLLGLMVADPGDLVRAKPDSEADPDIAKNAVELAKRPVRRGRGGQATGGVQRR